MKRASYREAIAWIGENDDAGASDAHDPAVVQGYVTSALIADIFGVADERVGRDVVRYRKTRDKK